MNELIEHILYDNFSSSKKKTNLNQNYLKDIISLLQQMQLIHLLIILYHNRIIIQQYILISMELVELKNEKKKSKSQIFSLTLFTN